MAFRMTARMLKVAALGVGVTFAAPAWALVIGDSHTGGASKANKFLVMFVRSEAQCTSTDRTHNAPLAFPACAPARESTALSFGPKGTCQATGKVLLNSAKQALDIPVQVKCADVHNGADGTGTPFDGTLTAAAVMRLTDNNCTPPGPCTSSDTPFTFAVPCGSAAALPSGKCLLKTTANAAIPAQIVPGKAMSIELQQWQISQGGVVSFVSGLFAP